MGDASASASETERRWYVRHGAQVRGPLTSAKVRREVLDGRLDLSDGVSRDRLSWAPLAEVAEVVPLQLRRDGENDAAAVTAQAQSDRRRALGATWSAAALVLTAVAATLWLGSGVRDTAGANCVAAPVAGVNWSNCRLDGLQHPSAVLVGADLKNASLINARLNDADLAGADLAYVNLTGAQLSYARLQGVRLLGANLRGADLTHAEFTDADLSHADLTGAQTGGSQWQGARLGGAIWVDGRRCAVGSVGECGY